jgi:hypothetical protein
VAHAQVADSSSADEPTVPAFPETGTYKTDKLGAITVWGLAGQPQSAEKPYSIGLHGDVLRLEARQGDRRQKPSEVNREIERCEVSFQGNPFEFKATYRLTFEMLFESGPPTAAANDKFFQIHNVNDKNDVELGPLFAMQLQRDRMRIVTRWDASARSTARAKDHWVFEDTDPIKRGHWYRFDITIRCDPFGDGMVNVARDGVVVANYVGPLGYNDEKPPYFKVGIYRETQADTQARRYRKLHLEKLE